MSKLATDQDLLAPIVKSIHVALPPARAFSLFTRDIQRWWPLATHSVFGADAVTCGIEGHVGGQIYEADAAGRRSVWGTVTRWEPPHRLACTWHPGRTPATEQELELRFEAAGEGTSVTLTHRGWEQLGADGPATRANYESGWDLVLGGYRELAGPAR